MLQATSKFPMISDLSLMPPALPRPTARLIIGIVISAALHVAAISALRPTAPYYVPPRPLQVEIRHLPPPPLEPAAELTVPVPADYSAAPAAVSPPPPAPGPAAVASVTTRESSLDLKVPLDKYFTVREVDVRAKPVNDVDLVYPKRAYEMRMKGRIRLSIFINEQGRIDKVSILESKPPGVFEEAALTATLALQFSPAIKDGRNVKSQQTVEVNFDPYESINIP